MRAILYKVNPVGHATCLWLRNFWQGCLRSRLNGLRLREVAPPELPGDEWVRVRTLLGGICGSDIGVIAQKQPPNSILQAFSSQPMALGHENVAVVEEVGKGVDDSWVGRRVAIEPSLGCEARGIDPPCRRCRAGEYSVCEKFGDDAGGAYHMPPGRGIGYNARTGGSWGEVFVAHRSQLVGVPDELDDEQALLTDPIACGLHAVLRVDLREAANILVYGTGVLGLGVIAALRALGYAGKIDALGRSAYLEPRALAFGADAYLRLPPQRRGRFAAIAERTGGSFHRARFGNYMLMGGYDAVFECVGSAQAVTESLKWARARGQVVLLSTARGGGVDLTPVWFRELSMVGASGRQIEHVDGREVNTYQLAHEMMTSGKIPVAGLLTHKFPLGEYRRALAVAMNKSKHQAIKVALDFR